MSEKQLDSAINALESRSISIQNYVQEIGCFDLSFIHSLNKDFKSAMCKLDQSSAIHEDLRNKLSNLKQDEAHYYDLEECMREYNIPIPTVVNVSDVNDKVEVPSEDPPPVDKNEKGTPEVEEEVEEQEIRFTLNNAEFNSVPKYMRGRMFAKDLNEILVVMNDMLIHKRDLLNKPFRTLSAKDKDLVVKWKEGQNAKTGSALFLREPELKEKLNDKQRLNLRNVLPCLRHVKRVRELRDKGQLILYPLWM